MQNTIILNQDNTVVINGECIPIPPKIINSWPKPAQYMSYIHYIFRSNLNLGLYDIVKILHQIDLEFYHNTLEFWKFLSMKSGIDIGISEDVMRISSIAAQGNHKLG